MGSTTWSDDLYEDRRTYREETSTPVFTHEAEIRSGKTEAKAHDVLSPLNIKPRESRDSEAHPNSKPVGVMFDVTGSMARVPQVVQSKLGTLMETLLDKGYCKDPQILTGAIGDSFSDRVPLQMSQFESGIEIDEQLGLIYREAGGGPGGRESYQLALYAFARKTDIDCWNKRGEKGYLFLMGDEMVYDRITREEARTVFGDTLQEDVLTTDLIREVQQRFNLFFIIPAGTHGYGDTRVREHWQNLVGAQNVIMLEDANLISETIGAVVGMIESDAALDKVVTDVTSTKGDALTLRNALTSLAPRAASATGGVPAAVKSTTTTRL